MCLLHEGVPHEPEAELVRALYHGKRRPLLGPPTARSPRPGQVMRTWAAEIAEYEGEIILQRLVQIVDGDQAVVAVDVTLLAADVTLLKDAFQQFVGKRRQ